MAVHWRSPSNQTELEKKRMVENLQIQVCKACRNIRKKTWDCNRCQMLFNRWVKGLNTYVNIMFKCFL